MRVTVLGGDGFIGSAVARALRDRAVGVAIVRRPRAASPADRVSDGCQAVVASAPDVVVHAAAPPSIEDDWAWDEERSRLRALASLRIPTIIIGSAAVLAGSAGDAAGRLSEAVVPRPLSPYGHFKHAQEQESQALRHAGWPVCVVRLFNPIGPAMKPSLMLGTLVQQIVARERCPTLAGEISMGDLSAHRDYCHVDDAADAIEAIIRLPVVPHVVHVGSGEATLTRDVAAMALAEAERPGLRILEEPSRSAGPARVIGDPSLIHRLTGWSARRTIPTAIRDALAAERTAQRSRAEGAA